ncbi:hypothetical protein KKB71_01875 [Patescibacteria group bacterium]|nr:hypothetical protein [Patescibacteria group bacterium]MBU2219115.1 hypothetical protein [Patescibacteria group bacterium]MBU2263429.1 hypothetical protein [Patescibacteria group bacterium]
MATITIPKNLIKSEDLVIIPRKEYEEFLEIKKEERGRVTEADVLRWSREAKKLKKAGKLPLFKDLIKKEYPSLAKKYNL